VLILCSASILGFQRGFLFLKRLVLYPHISEITGVDYYTPRAWIHPNTNQAPDQKTPPRGANLEAYREWVRSYLEKTNSKAILISKGGKLLVEEYASDFSRSSTFNSMSLFKTLISLMVGIGIDRGEITSLEEKVSTELSDFPYLKGSSATLQNYLEMASGLENLGSEWNPWSLLVQMHLGRDLVQALKKMREVEVPGSHYAYNNANSQILALFLKRRLKKPFFELFQEWVWDPLQGGDAFFWLDRVGGHSHVYCCFFARPLDWLRVGELLLRNGKLATGKQLVSKAWVQRMVKPSKTNPQYGLHIWLGNNRPDGIRTLKPKALYRSLGLFYLDGRAKQRVYILPNEKTVIVRVGENANHWDDAELPNSWVKQRIALE